MPDSRIEKLADVLIGYSTQMQAGEKVLIEAFDAPDEIVTALIRRTVAAGAIPFVETKSNVVLRELYRTATAAQMQSLGEIELARMQQMDAYIGLRGSVNPLELADVPQDRMKLYQTLCWRPVADYRVNKTKWVVLRYPSAGFANAAGMSTEAFTDFFFNVCTLDYAKMAEAQIPLHRRMEQADRVRLTGANGTNLEFSIKNIGAVMCKGDRNIPDGECFSCPVKESVNGIVHFNAPTVYQGTPFDSIRLVFKDGKIVEATGSDTTRLNEILDTDEGARYIGEFSIAFNPYIMKPMRDILFDEKIAGSFHFTPGNAYETAGNGNVSSVHWDMVYIQRPEYGGGEIWFDDTLIRKDGLFVPDDLHGLNPENLK